MLATSVSSVDFQKYSLGRFSPGRLKRVGFASWNSPSRYPVFIRPSPVIDYEKLDAFSLLRLSLGRS